MQVFVDSERDTDEVDDAGRTFFRTLLDLRVWHSDEDAMEEELKDFLKADPDVSALLGERIACGQRPQGELFPCGVVHRITGPRDYHMQGSSGLMGSLVQLDLWAETWLAAKQAARAAAVALKPLAIRQS